MRGLLGWVVQVKVPEEEEEGVEEREGMGRVKRWVDEDMVVTGECRIFSRDYCAFSVTSA